MDYSKKTVHYNNFPGTGSFLGIIIVEFCISFFCWAWGSCFFLKSSHCSKQFCWHYWRNPDQDHGLIVRDVENQQLLPIRTLRLSKLKTVETDLASTTSLIPLLLQYLNEGKLGPQETMLSLEKWTSIKKPGDGVVCVVIESDQ